MTDMEKVIKGLECCQYSSKSHCDGCPYIYVNLCNTNDCTADLASDAIAMLKEYKSEYEHGFNDAMLGKQELMYEGVDGKWHKKDW